ncbi:hypothetical protein ACQVRV_00180 (plasmid) [Ralstonia pseudosolanacearum]
MALPANTSRVVLVLALAVVGLPVASAQVLYLPNPVERLSPVVQFGVPRDTKFVFCDEADCPERSIKHLAVPPPPDLVPALPSVQPTEELSHAKAVPAKAKHTTRKPKRKKPTTKYECGHVQAK